MEKSYWEQGCKWNMPNPLADLLKVIEVEEMIEVVMVVVIGAIDQENQIEGEVTMIEIEVEDTAANMDDHITLNTDLLLKTFLQDAVGRTSKITSDKLVK